jgi:hypothetical protein
LVKIQGHKLLDRPGATTPAALEDATVGFLANWPVPGEFRLCRHFHPRDQDELSQSFDFPIFKRGNQIETGLFKGER